MENVHQTAIIGEPAQWRGKDNPLKYRPEIHPSATVGALTCIDSGCERPTRVGARTQVMKQVHIGHGVQIGEECDIATGTVIAGEVTIGNRVRIGINATILPWRKIGDGARIGAGAVLVAKEVGPFEVWAGNPAKFMYRVCEICGKKESECDCTEKVDDPVVAFLKQYGCIK